MKKLFLLATILSALIFAPGVRAIGIVGATIDNPSGLPADIEFEQGGDTAVVTIHTYWSPSLPPLLKIFETDGTGGIIHLVEDIHIHEGVPWTDWDEQLLVPASTFGGWAPSPDDDDLWWGDPERNEGAGATSNPPGSVVVDHPNDILIIRFSQPLQPSTWIHIEKDILVPEGMQTFAVAQWPTVPEPSVYALGGLALLGLLRMRRK